MSSGHQEKYRALSSGEELFNSLTHGLGALFSVAALIVLVITAQKYGDARHLVSFSVYGVSLVLLYLSSTLYHSFSSPKLKNLFGRFDHVSIFLLIAGTYTPILMTTIRGALGWSMLVIIWTMAVAGAIIRSVYVNRFRKQMVVIYLVMGWLFVMGGKQMFESLSSESIWFLILGGLAYSIGVIFYLWRKLPYGHGIWHLFVLAGSALHFFAIYYTLGR